MLDIAEAVYRDRLGPRDTARMIADDNDHGEKLRNRAKCYLPLVIPFAKALSAWTLPARRCRLRYAAPRRFPLPP